LRRNIKAYLFAISQISLDRLAISRANMAEKKIVHIQDPEKEPPSPTTTESTLPIDPAIEKKLLRKVDLNLIPILFLLFLCAFIDR
jgi:hypothetical protein